MQVVAFATQGRADWQWRIVSYSGETMEESFDAFPTIAAAIAKGSVRLAQIDVPDRTVRQRTYRSRSPLVRRPPGFAR